MKMMVIMAISSAETLTPIAILRTIHASVHSISTRRKVRLIAAMLHVPGSKDINLEYATYTPFKILSDFSYVSILQK